jgi:arylsulfatase B
MIERAPVRSLVLAFTLGVAGFLPATEISPKPNILIIVADDLGYADVGFTGATEIKTPNLDRFAASGVRLDRFYAAPVCSPTRAGLLTGRWPIRYGLMKAVIPPWSRFGLSRSERTLPEWLAEAGYDRRGMVGKWHLGHHEPGMLPLQRGFTHFYGHYNGAIDYFTHQREGELDWHRQDEPAREPGYATDLLADEAVKFIEQSPDGKPWVLYAAFNAPHDPLQAKPEDLEKYSALKGRRRTYAAMVDNLDQAVGRLLAAVEKRPDADNTLILFMSDNGGRPEFSDNRPWRGGKFEVYEGGIRVCAAVRWKSRGLSGGSNSAAMLGYIDVVPTLLAAAQVPLPSGTNALDGIDMMPVLGGQKSAPERPWYSYFAQGGRPPAAAVIEGDWKLVRTGGEVLKAGAAQKNELFNLSTDFVETNDLAEKNPDVVARLERRLVDFGLLASEKEVGEYGEGRDRFTVPRDWIIKER